jgi:hypothetical protein
MKRIILLAVMLFPATVMFGQFSFGLKLGANFSKLSSNIDTISSSMTPGFQVGAFVRVGKRFYVQPEAYYTLAGGKLSGDTTDWNQKFTVGSLDIPVLVGFKILNAKIVNLRILAGPMVSFITNSKVTNESTAPFSTSDLNTVNWAIQAGAGVDVLFLTFDVRYQWGLNDIIKTAGSTGTPVNSKLNTWVLSLGFKL